MIIRCTAFNSEGASLAKDASAARYFSVCMYQSMNSSTRMPVYSYGSASVAADILDTVLTETIILLHGIGISIVGVCMDGGTDNRFG